jgi:DNA-binding transcriptional LysR family regulator
MYPGVELRLLRYVVAVAEELHFSRAAERLHVAQPSLSKQIRDLEDEIGIRLFDRTKRDVHLTAAGGAFVAEAKEALVHSQRAVHAAKATQQPDRFTLGHSPDINPRLLSSLRLIPAQLWKLTFRSVFTMEQLQLIRAGELDAGVVILPVPDDSLTIEPILTEPLMVALPEGHELCSKKSLRLRDLNNVPLISIPKSLHPYFYDRVYSICIREGFEPKIAQEVTSFPEAMALVADGVGFAFTRECYERFKCSGVVFKKIDGQPLAVESAIVFRKGARSSVLPSIIAALQVKKKPASVLAFRSKAAG